MLRYEQECWACGVSRVAGVDEAGRGPLAGPVLAVAIVLPRSRPWPAVDDSKKLSPRQRDRLATALRQLPGLTFGVGIVDAQLVDQLNILAATHLAMRQALANLGEGPTFVLVDGLPVPGLPLPSRAIVGGDGLSASIAAASILAKVARDQLMVDFDRQFPQYGFAKHKGYGTRQHLEALRCHGPCAIHRRTFAPVASCLEHPNRHQLQLPGLG